MISRVCVAGAGVIGSLFAGHLARVAEVSVLTRRQEHADALNEHGLRVSGRSDFTARVVAATGSGRAPGARPRDRRLQGDRSRAGRRTARGPLRGRRRDDGPERPRRRGDRPPPRRLAARLGRHVHERHAPRGHARRVHPRHGDLDRPVRGTTPEARRGRDRRADPRLGAEGRGLRRPAPGAVVEADLQRDGQRRRGAHRPAARPALRAPRSAVRPRLPRPRPDRRGQGVAAAAGIELRRGSVGDERARDAAAAAPTTPRCSRTSRRTGRPRSS